MSATFHSLRDSREPKALKAVSLLKNLTAYDHSEGEAKALVNALLEAVDEVDAAFAKKWKWGGDVTADLPMTAAPEGPRVGNPDSRSPAWANIREAAEKATLKDLTFAMAVYINRIDEELNK